MTRRLRIEWSPGRKVSALLGIPSRQNEIGVLLAHGAGSGQRSQFIDHIRRGLVASGFATMSFDYPYMEEGRGRPDQLATLLACHQAALGRLLDYTSGVVLAGKSMGGRIGAHVTEGGSKRRGLVFYGYPFIAPGKTEPRPTDQLAASGVPMLFVSGTRDPLGPIAILKRALAGLPNASASIIEGGNHSLKVPKASGRTYEEVMNDVVSITSTWIEGL